MKLLSLLFSALGSVVAGFLSDSYGRRGVCLSFFTWTVLVGLVRDLTSFVI